MKKTVLTAVPQERSEYQVVQDKLIICPSNMKNFKTLKKKKK